MNSSNCLELILTDKQSGEEWECSYDVTYIENLTRKTGNFKQFEIFTTMVKSGLLKTSDCITLELLTYEDLESMRVRKIKSSTRLNNNTNNRRYLIVTYSVEFDRINYPLPLEYCGPPDPLILQATVRKLESELNKTREELAIKKNFSEKRHIKELVKRIDELTMENNELNEEVNRLSKLLNKNPRTQVKELQKAITHLEKSVKFERNSHHKLEEKLESEKIYLANQLDRVKRSEKCLKSKLQSLAQNNFNFVKNDYKNKHCTILYDAKDARKKSLPVKINTDPFSKQRSRSASPRIIHGGAHRNPVRPYSKAKQQSQSRSSSSDSRRELRSQLLLNLPINISASDSPRRSRGSSPYSGSGSVTTISYTSLTNNLTKKHSVPSTKRTTARPKSLETHINKLLKNRM